MSCVCVYMCEAGSASTYMYTTECDRHLGITFRCLYIPICSNKRKSKMDREEGKMVWGGQIVWGGQSAKRTRQIH